MIASADASAGFQALLVVLLLAFAVPLLLARFRAIPNVVGEILAGVAVGKTGFGWVAPGNTILGFMSDVGLAFLMFLAGMEIDFAVLFKEKREKGAGSADRPSLVSLAFLAYAITLGLALPSGLLLRSLGLDGNPLLLGFILSATSLGVLLPILKERGLLRSPFGQAVFLTASLADFITVLLLTVFLVTHDKGFDARLFLLLFPLLAFFVTFALGRRITRIPALRRLVDELSHATAQLKVRGSIAMLIAFVVLAEYVQAEAILGAFLAGMVVGLVRGDEDEALVHKLEAFGFGFFIPVFFILVGVGLDLRSLLRSPGELLLLPALLGVAIIVKTVPTLVFRKMFSWREIAGASLLLNTHLSLEIAVAVIGLRTGMLSESTATVLILFAVVTVLAMPLIFGAIQPARAPDRKRPTLILGAGDLGLRVGHFLEAHGDEVQYVEPDPARAARAREEGFAVQEQVAEGLWPSAKAVLGLSSDDQRNLAWCRAALTGGAPHVMSFVSDASLMPEYQEAGIHAFTPVTAQVTMVSLMARNPDLLRLLTSTEDTRDVWECTLLSPALEGRELRKLGLPPELLVLSIRRAGEVIIPHGSTRVERRDVLTLLGGHEALEEGFDVLSSGSA